MSKALPPNNKRGEIHELQEELNNPKEEKRKEAVKKVIAAMTVGKDVSSLFTDVLNCIQTHNLELKKLVYLYVVNHAKMNPDRAILVVNTFQKDCQDNNPLIRALAIRTMGCIRVDRVTEYMCEPLARCLKDKDPYVKKTAAICVAKLYDMNPELVESQGFLEQLQQLLSDSNPTVVANAVAALTEINEASPHNVFRINKDNRRQLLNALLECTEWGVVFILNALSNYIPENAKEADEICDRVAPKLNHTNSAVVLGAVKCLMIFMDSLNSADDIKKYCMKMAPPLVTLLTTKEPEIQYVALRNINLIVQKRPAILAGELRVFIIKYNDPIYVKMEKLEIMIMLASEKNIEQVLHELKEAASEVDVEFVRKAVRAIGRCAIKIEKASERCVSALLELIQTKVNYVVQEAIIVIRDIFRKYPSKYESVIQELCKNLDTLDEPEAKAAMIWILGEYAERIENVAELLEIFLESFLDENVQVQLQLLTAIVKLYLKRPQPEEKKMVTTILNLATQEVDNPDLRDRGYVYWRLLARDPSAARQVVLGEKPLISDSSSRLESSLLDTLLQNISSLSSVYHKPPESFVTKIKQKPQEYREKKKKNVESLLGYSDEEEEGPHTDTPATNNNNNNTGGIASDLLDIFGSPTTSAAPSASSSLPLLLAGDQQASFGMEIRGEFTTQNGGPVLSLAIKNCSQAPMSQFAIQFNQNSFSVVAAQPSALTINPGQTVPFVLKIFVDPRFKAGPEKPVSEQVQIAIRDASQEVRYFACTLPYNVLFDPTYQLTLDEYKQTWKSLASQQFVDMPNFTGGIEALKQKFERQGFKYTASRSENSEDFLYFANKTHDNVVLLELKLAPNSSVRACIKSQDPAMVPIFSKTIANIIQA